MLRATRRNQSWEVLKSWYEHHKWYKSQSLESTSIFLYIFHILFSFSGTIHVCMHRHTSRRERCLFCTFENDRPLCPAFQVSDMYRVSTRVQMSHLLYAEPDGKSQSPGPVCRLLKHLFVSSYHSVFAHERSFWTLQNKYSFAAHLSRVL